LQRVNLAKSGKVAARSFIVLVAVGIFEILAGVISGSVALIADGIHSFGDATVSFVVWFGLRFTRRAPDGKFHFGYYRVETFSSIVASLVMIVFGVFIFYESYLTLRSPRGLAFANLALVSALAATAVAICISVYKVRAARKFGSLALKTDALSSIKDVATSVIAFTGIALSHYFGLFQTDAIAGIMISIFIFVVSYIVIREASLVLMDACNCPDIVTAIKQIVTNITSVKEVYGIRLRKLGPYLVGDMHVQIDGNLSVYEAHKITTSIEQAVKQQFDEVTEFKVIVEPFI